MKTFVSTAGGRWRLDGELSVSRSIGDLPYIHHGLIAAPSLSQWFKIDSTGMGTDGAVTLILATDGLFENMSPAEVCSAAESLNRGAQFPYLEFLGTDYCFTGLIRLHKTILEAEKPVL